MSDLQLIENTLKRAARRRRLLHAWSGLWQGLLAGAILWVLVAGAYKLLPLPDWLLPAAGVAAGVLTLAGVIAGAARRVTLFETARWMDQHEHLQERLGTALELARTGDSEWKTLLVTDAAQRVKRVDPNQLLPLRLSTIGLWALLAVVLGVGLGFVPEYRTEKFKQKKQDIANVRDTGKQLAAFTRRTLVEHPPALEPTEKAIEKVAAFGDQLGKASLTRSEALRDLASVAEKLRQQARELGQEPALKPLERAAREPGAGNTSSEELQNRMDQLQKSLGGNTDPDKLDQLQNDLKKLQQAAANMGDKDSPEGAAARERMSQALADLARQSKDLGAALPGLEEAIAALQANQTDLFLKDLDLSLRDLEKMKQMAKAMQQLQQQMAKLGKDLAEQLDKGQAQAAQSTLKKMIDELKTANLSKEQLQKIMDEVSKAVKPGSQYGKVGEHLKNAAQQMQQGQKSDAAQSLAAASKELEKLMQQAADSQALQDALAALERAQMAIATGKTWEQCQGGQCQACGGLGCALCKGRGWGHGGKPGSGVGTWADEATGWTTFNQSDAMVDNSGVQRPDMDPRGETDRDSALHPNMAPTKVRGQMSPGGSMPSITLKGVSIKGQSSVAYEEAVTAAQSDAQSALNQDQVPRAYQPAVRDYFDDLKK